VVVVAIAEVEAEDSKDYMLCTLDRLVIYIYGQFSPQMDSSFSAFSN
jgi:hypothetical protein